MRNILPFSQSTFCSWGVDMSWFCSVYKKSFSRKDNMQRHVAILGLTPFHTVSMSSKNVSILSPAWLPERPVRKNGLGLISITASFRGNLPSPGEDRLVLFTMAACVCWNASRHATHWIRHRDFLRLWSRIAILIWTNRIWSCLLIR